MSDTNHSRSTYLVEPNETLTGVAERHLGSAERWTEIASANGLGPASTLHIGKQLTMPSPVAQNTQLVRQHCMLPSHTGQPLKDRPTNTLPIRGFFFVMADEANPFARKFVRKVLLPPKGVTDPVEVQRLAHPEVHGFTARDPTSSVSAGRHVGGRVDSRFLSASERQLGSPRFPGQRFWIDVEKAKAGGVTVHETKEIVADLDRVIAKTRNPVQRAKFADIRKLAATVDREVLLEGHVPAGAVKSGAMMGVTRGAQFVSGVGYTLTAYDLEQAGERSITRHSVRPLAAETVRQAGGWAGAWAGMTLGGEVGAALGIETGPGALLTGAVGGAIGGFIGFFSVNRTASWIER